jgi:hypothetical protein
LWCFIHPHLLYVPVLYQLINCKYVGFTSKSLSNVYCLYFSRGFNNERERRGISLKPS